MAEFDFECFTCNSRFSYPLFDIARAFERMIDTPTAPYPFEVDIQNSTGIVCYCSAACREEGRVVAMTAEGVPIPSKRPTYAPIEPCAICNAPVDLHQSDLTYSESTIDGGGRTTDFEYLAIVCPSCELKLDLKR